MREIKEIPNKKRKICFVITSKIHYARNKLVLKALHDHPEIELQVILAGSAILERFGNVEPDVIRDGFTIDAKIMMALEGTSPTTMAKNSGIFLLELPSILERLNPDVLLIRGDRYELLVAAIAAAYMNITIAHIEGGDITGTIDESVRHSITKLAHIHFATNADSANRIVRMGEKRDYVFTVGSPELEVVALEDARITNEDLAHIGVGDFVDLNKPYNIVMQHPVTSEYQDAAMQIHETLMAVHELDHQCIWFWPNIDAGSDEAAKAIRQYREQHKLNKIHFLRYLPESQFYALLKEASCLIGNSSSGIKECSLLGIPVVNIGTRQKGRRTSHNVINVPYNKGAIKQAILEQHVRGRYEPDHYYYKEKTADRVAGILASVPLYSQKLFHH